MHAQLQVCNMQDIHSKGLPSYEDFFDSSAGINLLDKDYQTLEHARNTRFKETGFDTAQIASKLRMLSIPLPGRETYQNLLAQWQSKGFTRLLDVGLDYIQDDVRPLLNIVIKFRQKFEEEQICVFKDYSSLPVILILLNVFLIQLLQSLVLSYALRCAESGATPNARFALLEPELQMKMRRFMFGGLSQVS